MSRLRRHLVPALLLLPIIFICGKLLFTPVYRQATKVERLLGRDDGVTEGQDIAQFGWPCVYLECLWWPPGAVQAHSFSYWLLLADALVLLAAIAAVARLLQWHFRGRGAWLRFSLRELFAIVAIFGAAIGWWMTECSECSRQRQVVAQLSQKPGLAVAWEAYCGPEWLRRLWPADDFPIFQRPTGIGVMSGASQNSINELPAVLRELTNVNSLFIENHSGFRVTDPSGFERIERIDFFRADVDDASLAGLVALPRLRSLSISGHLPTDTPDRGFAHIGKCQALEGLEILDATVTDEQLTLLASLHRLRLLWLSSSQLTDAAVDVLMDIKSLEHLNIEFSPNLTDRGLRRLVRQLPNLKTFGPPDVLSPQTIQLLKDRKVPGFY